MKTSLYTRLGGYDAIAMFATKLIDQAQQDYILGRFWENRVPTATLAICKL